MGKHILAVVIFFSAATLMTSAAGAGRSLHGIIVDRETKAPVEYVTVVMDGAVLRISAADGSFSFGAVSPGRHVITFDHIAYKRVAIKIDWPSQTVPLRVELEPRQFMAEEIVVRAERVPPGGVTIRRSAVAASAGNLANDPLRTVQSQPSCAPVGIDFLSKTAIRGGDVQEHGVYFDGYPLKHYAHAGGFAGVVYDDMLEKTLLIPGTAPIQYQGHLSGVVLLEPIEPDTNYLSLRYDITSMAGGASRMIAPAVAVQASGKTSFFNLPVYQEVGVEERSFRDFLGRLIISPGKSIALTTTLLAASDSEIGKKVQGIQPRRRTASLLAGVYLAYRAPGWEISARPSYSRYDFRDAVSWRLQDREHRLNETRLQVGMSRRGSIIGLGLSAAAGNIRHAGNGGTREDYPYSGSVELELKRVPLASITLALGGSREPWTSRFEPQAYGGLQITYGDLAVVSAGFRRSHQSPFHFYERRYFASLPIDAGDLLSAYYPSWRQAPAVRMDQVSAGATVALPLRCQIEMNGFQRGYGNLLTWEWEDFPALTSVGSGGAGRGSGYEIILARIDPDFVSVMAAVSRARVWKREGTLDRERIGNFDRPNSWQLGISSRISRGLTLSLRLADADGQPYTPYVGGGAAPSAKDVNSVRLPRFRRLDLKLLYEHRFESFEMEFFVDAVNVLNRENIVMMYAQEYAPGEFISTPYGGTAPFPIGGMTIRW